VIGSIPITEMLARRDAERLGERDWEECIGEE
jgi:hypothetical protein